MGRNTRGSNASEFPTSWGKLKTPWGKVVRPHLNDSEVILYQIKHRGFFITLWGLFISNLAGFIWLDF